MSTPRGAWSIAGAVAGLAGLAVSHAAAMALTLRSSPLVAVGETVIQLVPGVVAEGAIKILGSWDRPVLMTVVFLLLMGLLAWAGRLAEHSWWKPLLLHLVLGGIGLAAVLTRYDGSALDVVPVVAGVVTWIVALSFLTDSIRRHQQEAADGEGRRFLVKAGLVALVGLGAGIVGDQFGRTRRQVERTRRLLNLPVSDPHPPSYVRAGVDGMPPWRTPNQRFYRVHTALVVPAIEPVDWRLRIHGMVEREVTLTYRELVDRRITEDWITLNCVSNEVGGDLIGNAWWSGVRLAPLLRRAGVSPDADAVLQTSHDGWTCGTPLAALTDDRNAMLAIAMNGEPLPIDHGFPVRTIVPGLYGYVSACKWVVDLEVSRFDRIEAFWTTKGWAEKGPVKLASRIDVPESGGEVTTGVVTVAGHAWSQHTGISGVEVAVDGGAWRRADLAAVPNLDTWLQWRVEVEVEEGEHEVRVRAIDRDGEVQTGVVRDVLPDGATGWHAVSFTAT